MPVPWMDLWLRCESRKKEIYVMRLYIRTKNKLLFFSVCVLFLLLMCVLFGECIAPYHYETEDRINPYEPPTRIHFVDSAGQFHFWPFVYAPMNYLDGFHNRVYEEVTTHRYPVAFFVRGEQYRLWGLIPSDLHLFGVVGDAKLHLFGTDARGRDLFSRTVMGTRISLTVGIVGVFIALVLGMSIGGVAGYFGGFFDYSIMRVAELFMMVPTFYLLLAVRSALPAYLTSPQVYFLVTCILSMVGWAGLARVVRGMVLSIKGQEYIAAARLLGRSEVGIMYRHVLPQIYGYLCVAMSISVPGYIVAESALSMLGLGIQEPFISWGMLLGDAMAVTQLTFHPWLLIPGVFLCVTVFACNVVGDSLRDMLDPRTRKDSV